MHRPQKSYILILFMIPDDELEELKNSLGLTTKKDRVIQPLHDPKQEADNPALSLIRGKINALYANEPNAKEELAEAKAAVNHQSKHQKYMYDLSKSGRSLADIQTAWHTYYTALPDPEKHEVWQEFYANHSKSSEQDRPSVVKAETGRPINTRPQAQHKRQPRKPTDSRSVLELKDQLLHKVGSRAKQKAHHHKSLLFGISMGLLMTFIMLFGFFNERFIAPFITPSKVLSATPIILGSDASVGPEPKIIIPKINVEIPIVYDVASVEEDVFQQALEGGVVHYRGTSHPGETGNTVIFGHSSNNILNRGKYKFAFVLLSRLENGDTFMLHHGGKRYVYRVNQKKIVPPTDLSVLGPTDKPSVTLITCDPPGTAINRLVVVGEQISPDPTANIASSGQGIADTDKPALLPSDSPSLWSRFREWLSS